MHLTKVISTLRIKIMEVLIKWGLVKKLSTYSAVNNMLPICLLSSGAVITFGNMTKPNRTEIPDGNDSCSFKVNEEHDNNVKYWIISYCRNLFPEVFVGYSTALGNATLCSLCKIHLQVQIRHQQWAGNQHSLTTILAPHPKTKRHHLHFLEMSFRTAVGGTLFSHNSVPRPLWAWVFCKTLPDTVYSVLAVAPAAWVCVWTGAACGWPGVCAVHGGCAWAWAWACAWACCAAAAAACCCFLANLGGSLEFWPRFFSLDPFLVQTCKQKSIITADCMNNQLYTVQQQNPNWLSQS